jgi:hypothetical protein
VREIALDHFIDSFAVHDAGDQERRTRAINAAFDRAVHRLKELVDNNFRV